MHVRIEKISSFACDGLTLAKVFAFKVQYYCTSFLHLSGYSIPLLKFLRWSQGVGGAVEWVARRFRNELECEACRGFPLVNYKNVLTSAKDNIEDISISEFSRTDLDCLYF